MTPAAWSVGGGLQLPLTNGPLLMAILNVTPDSFSDGGQHADPASAVAAARAALAAGAHIVDVGGESTRPGAQRVPVPQQVERTVPVVRALAPHAVVSIDTTRAAVAQAALAAGARIVNDVSAGTEDPAILRVAAEHSAGLVLMHRLAPPEQEQFSHQYQAAPTYTDVVRDVCAWLAQRAQAAMDAGVPRQCIALDPGLGFGKNVQQNFTLLQRLPELCALGFPVLVGASRKSFVGAVTGVKEPARRVHGSVGAALAAVAGGAHVLRVHDVAPHAAALSKNTSGAWLRWTRGAHAPDGS